MDSTDIDTSRFESWPLLQPNEIHALPTVVLRASMAELDKMLKQGSDESGDAIVDYARRQQDRAKSILLERAAQDRVRALLGEDFTSLSMAPFDGLRAKQSVGCDGDTLLSSEDDCQAVKYSDFSGTRSPPQQPRGGKSLNMDPSEWNKDEPGAEQQPCEMYQRSSTTSTSDLPMNGFDMIIRSEPDGQGIVDHTEHRSDPCVERATQQKQHSKFRGRRPSFNKAMHEKWGSVFVVEGSQRRRRMPVRKRSMEDADSPKAREEQIRKERRERREASLRRLLARKEKQAHQQEARRKHNAAAVRKALAARPSAAATSEEIATKKGAGIISLQPTESSPRGRPRPRTSITSPRDFNDDMQPGKAIACSSRGGRYVAGPSEKALRAYETTSVSGQQLEVNRSRTGNTAITSQNLLETERPGCGSCSSSESESVSGGDSSDGDISMSDEECQRLALQGAMSIVKSPDVTEGGDIDARGGASVENSRTVSVANLGYNLKDAVESGVITTVVDRAYELPQSPVRLNSLDGSKSRPATCLPGEIPSSDMTSRRVLSSTTQVVGVPPQTKRVVAPQSYPDVPKIEVDLIEMQPEKDVCSELPAPLDFRTNPYGHPDAAIGNIRTVDVIGRHMSWENQRPKSTPAPNTESKTSVRPLSGVARTASAGNFVGNYERSLSDGFTSNYKTLPIKIADDQKIICVRPKVGRIREGVPSAHKEHCNANIGDWGTHLNASLVDRVKTEHLHEDSGRPITPLTSHAREGEQSPTSSAGVVVNESGGEPQLREDYDRYFPQFAAVLTAFHSGRALTRESDCSSLPLTSAIMSKGRTKRLVKLTAAEERSCLQLQWKLYSIYVRVIKDYAAVFSHSEGWPINGDNDPSSLVYRGDPSALHYRVCSKARPDVYNIVADVLNKRCKQWEELPTGLGLKTTWNLLWTWSKPRIQYSSLLAWQKARSQLI